MQDAGAPPPGTKGEVRNPTTDLILTLVTCGLYGIFWLYARAKEVNTYLGEEKVKPIFIIPGCLCYPLILVANWHLANSLKDVQAKAGVVPEKDETTFLAILLMFVAPVGVMMFQQRLNDCWEK